MKDIDFHDIFSFIFCIVEIDYFFNAYPVYERFQIGFFNEMFIIFDQKKTHFLSKIDDYVSFLELIIVY